MIRKLYQRKEKVYERLHHGAQTSQLEVMIDEEDPNDRDRKSHCDLVPNMNSGHTVTSHWLCPFPIYSL